MQIIDLDAPSLWYLMGTAVDAEIVCAKALIDEGNPVALGGIARLPGDDRLWAFLDVQTIGSAGLRTVRALARGLHACNEDVFIQCAGPHAERLLRILGFTPTGETKADLRTNQPLGVWKWQSWPL